MREEDKSSATQSRNRAFIFGKPNLGSSEERSITGGQTNAEVTGESYSGNDVDFEGVQGFLAKGLEKYNRNSSAESEEILRHGLKIAQG